MEQKVRWEHSPSLALIDPLGPICRYILYIIPQQIPFVNTIVFTLSFS